MSTISINLTPRYRLAIVLTKTRRRAVTVAEPLFPSLSKLRKSRRGNIISRFFRHVFEHSKLKRILGTNLALLLVASSFVPSFALESQPIETNVVTAETISFVTERGVVYPLAAVRITQGYSVFHRGIDFDGVTGDAVHPIIDGTVTEVSKNRFGYGNTIVIDHGNSLSSRYAHLSRLEVRVGQIVSTSTVIGEVGATGRSFGDHLHLEVMERGVQVNPLSILPR